MIVVVMDTNVLVSGILGFPRGSSVPGELLRRWIRQSFAIALSDHVADELVRTLDAPWISRRVDPRDVQAVMGRLALHPRVDPPPVLASGLATHPEDDLVIATAVAARAGALVTGDHGLLRLGSRAGGPVVSPPTFPESLDAP